MKTILLISLTACMLIGCNNQTTSLTPQEKAFAGKYYAITNDTVSSKQMHVTVESYTDYKVDRNAPSSAIIKLVILNKYGETPIMFEYELKYNSNWAIRNDTLFENLIPDSYKINLKDTNQDKEVAEKLAQKTRPLIEIFSAQLKEMISKHDAARIVEITPQRVIIESAGVNDTIKKVK